MLRWKCRNAWSQCHGFPVAGFLRPTGCPAPKMCAEYLIALMPQAMPFFSDYVGSFGSVPVVWELLSTADLLEVIFSNDQRQARL